MAILKMRNFDASGRRFVWVCLLFMAGLPTAFGESKIPLRSPWDTHPVKLTQANYECPSTEHLSADLTMEGYYIDKQSSVIDPVKWKAYAQASGPYRKLGQSIVNAADDYRATGSRAAAACGIKLMTVAARDGVFTGTMSSRQAYYVQGWITGAIAIAYLKVRDSGLVSSEETLLLQRWFETIVRQTEDFYKSNGATNNHLYWAGLEVLAAGVASNDQQLFDWGVEAYRTGAAQIDANGEMPLEMHRGRRALHYHFYALAPLVYLAEFGAVNGIDLYSVNDHALSKLVHFCLASEKDGTYIAQAAGSAQEERENPPSADQMSWTVVWQSRFQDPDVAAFMVQAGSISSLYLGGLPPGSDAKSLSRR